MAVFFLHKLLIGHFADQRQQRVIIIIDIHQPDRLLMQPDLTPGKDLSKLFQGTEAARQRDKAVRQFNHFAFTFMRGADAVKLSQVFMSNLPSFQQCRDHADGLPAFAEYGIRHRPHDPHTGTAVNQGNSLLNQNPGKFHGLKAVNL